LSRPSAASRDGSPNSSEWWRTENFSYISKSSERLRREGDYAALEKLYRHAIAEARRAGNLHAQISYWTALGNTYVFLYRYAEAVDAYIQARELATAIGDWEAVGAVAPGLSSVYLLVGDETAARDAAENGLMAMRKLSGHPYYATQLRLQYARLNAGSPSVTSAIGEAVNSARAQDDVGLEAQAWDQLGEEYQHAGRLDAAEDALDQAYRIRLLQKPADLRLSYWRLGALRLAQQRLDEGELLTEKAILANTSVGANLSNGVLYHQRGLIHQSQGRKNLALRDFEAAAETGERWRSIVPGQQSSRTAADAQLDRQIFHSYIGTAARWALDHRDQDWTSKAFLAVERNRAFSLQRLPNYSTGIQKSPVKLESFPTGFTLIEFQQGLQESELVLSFYTEATESYLWAVTRESLHLYRLPSGDQIGKVVERFKAALLAHEGTASRLGTELYDTLFGQLSAREAGHTSWIFSLDGALFELPFAALRSDRAHYLVESHSLQVTPSSAFLRQSPFAGSSSARSEFLAVGDPIYNSADDRLPAEKKRHVDGQLNRLVASGDEISRSSESWPGRVTLLRGPSATRSGFLESLTSLPATIHLATHIVAEPTQTHLISGDGPDEKAEASIAFSLGDRGRPEFLKTTDVAALQVNRALVVMTGCSSGTGEIRPGAGLLGLTRAWLAAGASSVLATGWPVEDTRGDLLPTFYQQLKAVPPAEALQRAQIAMIQSGTWESDAAYWAAFRLTGGAR
jgi:CHAT domain-containing protein